MTVIIIFIGLIVGLNCIPLLIKTNFPSIEKALARILISSTILFLTFTFLQFNGYRLKGLFTFPTISLIFIISTILYFAIFKNTKKKILAVFILIPVIILSFLTLIIGRVVNEFRIDDTNKISVATGGFLACGENINITQSRLGIFDKEVFHIDNLCLKGIYKIETSMLDEKHAEFLIYHNGQYDSENPYKYYVERKNGW